MSKNLLKQQFTRLNTENVRIIDSNTVLKRILPQEPDEDGFMKGLASDVLTVETPASDEETVPEETVYEGPSAEELIAEARQQIEDMKDEARKEALREAEQIRVDAQAAGYSEGKEKAERELKAAEQKMKERQKELEQEYEEQLDQMEPVLVDTIADIYEHVINVDLAPYKDIVTYLVTSTLKKTGEGKHCIVHVSSEDYPFVSSQKKLISASLSSGTAVEFVEDITLGRNDALIETDGGIFDCGLGTQLSELKSKLRLLSYERTEGK